MPLIRSPTKAALGKNISEMLSSGHPHTQAVAAALSNQRRFRAKHMHDGGISALRSDVGSSSHNTPSIANAQLPPTIPRLPQAPDQPVVGLIKSSVPGRTDQHPIQVYKDSYVIPADVVSTGFGQGNTAAGAEMLNAILNPHVKRGAIFRKRAQGGPVAPPEQIPIIAAGGEYVVHPHAVASIGNGDWDKGHSTLDKMVKMRRKESANHLLNLPGPRRD